MSKVTTLEQLQDAAARSLQAAGSVAKAAADAIQETLDAIKMDKPDATSFTIPVSGWSETGESDALGYAYYYDIAAEDVTAQDRVEITISPSALSAAVACGLCPTNESMDGVIRIWSTSVPEEEIPAEYWIEDGKEQEE